MNSYYCILCGRRGARGFVRYRWHDYDGFHRCTNETACARRIYRALRAG